MKIRFLNYIVGSLALTLFLSSCIKNEVKELGTAGTPRVRLGEAPANILYFTPFSDVKTVHLVTVRRDEVSQAGVDQPLTVKLTNVTDSIDAYNNAEGTNYEPLPDSLFTVIANKGVIRSGNVYTVTFQPGETAVTIPIALNGAKWNLSRTYAMYFKITDPAGREITTGHSEAIAALAVKNKYDAVYEITGTLVDANGLYTGDYPGGAHFDPAYPRIYSIGTTGPNSVLFYDASWDYPNYIVINIATGGAANTGIRPLFTFDPATDNLVSVVNNNNGAVATGVTGQFNAADRSADIKWVIGRWTVTEHWKFLRER